MANGTMLSLSLVFHNHPELASEELPRFFTVHRKAVLPCLMLNQLDNPEDPALYSHSVIPIQVS